MEQVLLYFTLKYKGNWDKIYDALDKKERVNQADLDAVSAKIVGCKYLTVLDVAYPNSLRQSYRPPFVIFYKGDISMIYKTYDTVGVIGDITKADAARIGKDKFIAATIDKTLEGVSNIVLTTQPIMSFSQKADLLIGLSYDKCEAGKEMSINVLGGIAKQIVFTEPVKNEYVRLLKTCAINHVFTYNTVEDRKYQKYDVEAVENFTSALERI
jgi:hypothetical protein